MEKHILKRKAGILTCRKTPPHDKIKTEDIAIVGAVASQE